MTTQQAVIFDVDGVLVDSYQAHYESWQLACLDHGLAMTQDQFVATFGRTSREIIVELWGDRFTTPQAVAELDDSKEEFFREILKHDFPAMDGAAELIGALHQAGFRLAVGSSGPPENVNLVLDRLATAAEMASYFIPSPAGRGPSEGRNIGQSLRPPLQRPHSCFDGVVTGTDVQRGKPDPQVFLLAAERIGVAPPHCVVIEDAPAGVAAAHAAGMKCIAIASTGRVRESLLAADLVVNSLRDLDPARITQLLTERQA